MTGFGKGNAESKELRIDAEIKSVNSRFLDIVFKLPRPYAQFESAIRSLIAAKLERGRVEVFLTRKPLDVEACAVTINRALFDSYLAIYEELGKDLDSLGSFDRGDMVRDILARRDVVEAGEEVAEVEFEKELLLEAISQALDTLAQMRATEGERLGEDIRKRLQELRRLQKDIGEHALAGPEKVKERLIERLEKLAPEVKLDPERIVVEAALLADKIDVSEELVRLDSHIEQFQAVLKESPNGRKLEFLLQEFSREFNTIGSKAQNAEVQALVVAGKAEVEKLKEQIANVE